MISGIVRRIILNNVVKSGNLVLTAEATRTTQECGLHDEIITRSRFLLRVRTAQVPIASELPKYSPVACRAPISVSWSIKKRKSVKQFPPFDLDGPSAFERNP